jgi:hypothetical protein
MHGIKQSNPKDLDAVVSSTMILEGYAALKSGPPSAGMNSRIAARPLLSGFTLGTSADTTDVTAD